MTTHMGTLVSFMLKDYFGETIEKVGSFLFAYGTHPLGLISKQTGVPLEKTKIALAFLIRYGFVTFAEGKTKSVANYTLIPEKVLLLLRSSRYVQNIRKKYGNKAEILCELILCQGVIRCSDAILAAARRLQQQGDEVDLPLLRDTFFILIANQYVIRLAVPTTDESTSIPVLQINERDLYLHPEINIPQLTTILNEGKVAGEECTDQNIYWRLNFDRFHRDFRDELLISSIKRRTDENGGELMALLIKLMYIRTESWAECSNPIPVLEIKDILRTQNNNPNLLAHLDQYLNIIETDPCKFLSRIGDAGGGQFIINLKEAFSQLTWATIENIIMEKFGSFSARIFRLVRAKKFIEADNIPQLSMMQAKDAKRLTYQLLEENFLHMRELRKTQSNSGPMKTFILFHVNIDQVVRMLLNTCYKCMHNLKVKGKHFTMANKPIIEKKQRADAIELQLKANLPEDELNDILTELITQAEREVLEKIGSTTKKLNIAALDLDNTMFLLQLYILYTVK